MDFENMSLYIGFKEIYIILQLKINGLNNIFRKTDLQAHDNKSHILKQNDKYIFKK